MVLRDVRVEVQGKESCVESTADMDSAANRGVQIPSTLHNVDYRLYGSPSGRSAVDVFADRIMHDRYIPRERTQSC